MAKRPKRLCRNCKESFHPRRAWQEFCTEHCRTGHFEKKRKQARQALQTTVLEKKQCALEGCTATFAPKRAWQIFHSDKCREEHGRLFRLRLAEEMKQ